MDTGSIILIASIVVVALIARGVFGFEWNFIVFAGIGALAAVMVGVIPSQPGAAGRRTSDG